jgi:hypothetical protein
MRILTRGLTGSAGAIIVQGLGPIPVEIARIIRAGRTKAAQAFDEIVHNVKISVMLIEFNGKELVKPIINTIRKAYKDSATPRIEVAPTKLVVKQPDIKIKVKQVRSKNVNN